MIGLHLRTILLRKLFRPFLKRKVLLLLSVLPLFMMAGLAVSWQIFLHSLPPLDLKTAFNIKTASDIKTGLNIKAALHDKSGRGEFLADRLSLSPIVVDRQDRLLRAFTARDGRWRLPISQEQISPHYFKLLLNFEDQGYPHHNGVELAAFVRAGWQWLANGRIISGGSTLTMQVARLLQGPEARSLGAKWRQIKMALQLEKAMSKAEILDLYVRLSPFGGNLEGVRAASLAYFGKEPARLSIAEAALLVALPQSPEGRRPDRFPQRAKAARNRVLMRAYLNGLLSKNDLLYAKRQKIVTKRLAFPLIAPHVSEQMVRRALKQRQEPKTTNAKCAQANHPFPLIVRTSLSKPLQMGLERLAKRHASGLGPGVSAAILVVDHTTGAVLAHVGAADYKDKDRFGPIDMTDRQRSPGSTLKPFIYGLGFDAGLIHPESLIEDVPVRYGHYAPENFDGKFHGTVTIRQALQRSLNIPAVKLLAAVKPSRLAARFRAAGLKHNLPANLTVALGGAGFRLKDLVAAYLHIANPGAPLALNYAQTPKPLSAETVFQHRPLLSTKAAFYLSHILRGAPPPKNAKPGALAYKTGTSYGYRDGWAVGFDGRHLVGVWLGRPDGGPTTNLTGIGAAGPLLFDVFQQIGEKRVPFRSAPEGALFASGEDLPPPLRRFDKDKQRLVAHAGVVGINPVKIAFPPKGAEFTLQPQFDDAMMIAMKAEGGALPLTWMVNGKIAPSKKHLRQTLYKVKEPGFVEFAVIDARGKTDRVNVRVRPSP